MDFDDIVIGSGLSALGAVIGLLKQPGRRIGVLCGAGVHAFEYYDARRTVPCAYLGNGGMGSHWHGVIPTGLRGQYKAMSNESFVSLFSRFYPRVDIAQRLGTPGLFVPWRPIRPALELDRLVAVEGTERLTLVPEAATELRFGERGVQVSSVGGSHHAARGWLAAGTLHSPGLLEPICPGALRGAVSDHAFCYVGQTEAHAPPGVARSRDGVFHPAAYDRADTALYSQRPARFTYRTLDSGIEQRAALGLPTGSALAKISRRMSPGLLVEAFYSRFGIFGGSRLQSVYAQVRVPDAYDARREGSRLNARVANIRAATDAARDAQPFAGLRPSRRLDIHLPGIHLHHSLDPAALHRAGVDTAGSPLQVVDASALEDIGPDHHSFKMMVSAHERARLSGLAA